MASKKITLDSGFEIVLETSLSKIPRATLEAICDDLVVRTFHGPLNTAYFYTHKNTPIKAWVDEETAIIHMTPHHDTPKPKKTAKKKSRRR